MFSVKNDVKATKNDPRACRGRWSRCGGKYRNVNAVTWHICNACSIARQRDMALGFIAPNVRAVVATNDRKSSRKSVAKVANANARTATIDG